MAFLGHIVSAAGVECDPAKTEKVAAWPTPECLKDLRSFQGLASYYRRFLPEYAAISASLNELTKSGKHFVWMEVQEEAFNKLKQLLTSSPILSYPTAEGIYWIPMLVISEWALYFHSCRMARSV